MKRVELFDWMVCRDILSYQQIGPEIIRDFAMEFMQNRGLTIEEFDRMVAEYNREFEAGMAEYFRRENYDI